MYADGRPYCTHEYFEKYKPNLDNKVELAKSVRGALLLPC